MLTINEVTIAGSVGNDPEIKITSAGKKIAMLNIATSDKWTDKAGEKQSKTEWHRVIIYKEGLAGIVEQYVKKGMNIFIRGALQMRKYTDSSGNEKRVTEIILTRNEDILKMIDFADKKKEEKKPEQEYKQEPDMEDRIPF